MNKQFLTRLILMLVTGLLGMLSGALYAQDSGLSIKQKLLMPGPVISGHAEYETQCEQCHASFDKSQQSSLCLNCHEEINDDRQSQSGFHGKMGPASEDDCNTCHKDHKGRDADIIGLFESAFNHDATRFPLAGGHDGLDCNACHKDEVKFRDTPSACIDCHKDDDVHQGATGDQCESCHSDKSWQSLKPFDHSTTDYPLKGAHQEVACASCHIAQQYTFEITTCVSCHLSADVHGGSNGRECESCHNEKAWDEVDFDHSKTEFPLEGKHQDIPCRACHKPGDDASEAPTQCFGCHSNQDSHLGRNGKQCDSCHRPEGWSDIIFDHDRDTQYPLTGKHKELSCTQCHIGAIDDPLPLDCASCHKADDVHHNPEMKLCGVCHSTESWKATSLFDHDFTSFPLIGMHRIVPCQNCHIDNQFSGTDQLCDTCHRSDDIHKGSLGPDCSICHTPNAWNPWQFDHNTQTDFILDGKHKGLACESCHSTTSKAQDTSQVCGSCHKSEDIHNGEFGSQCDRCHSTSGFFELFILPGEQSL